MKTTKSILMAMALMLLMVTSTYATEYTSMVIEPNHVGVFYELGEQQFDAFGLTTEGEWVNITTEVDWYTEDMAFDEQPEDVVTIDQTGLVTINSAWGRVKISACYPKGCKIEPPSEVVYLPFTQLLLSNPTNDAKVDYDEDRYNLH